MNSRANPVRSVRLFCSTDRAKSLWVEKSESYSRTYLLFLLVIPLLLLWLVVGAPAMIFENPRFDSVIDEAVALIIFTISVLILLSQKLQSEPYDSLALGFLTVSILRFLGAATEDMDDVIWLHRISSLTLGLTFLIHAHFELVSTRRKRARLSFIVILGSALLLGIAFLLYPPFLPLAYYGDQFSFSIKIVSVVGALFFFLASLSLFSRRNDPRIDRIEAFPVMVSCFLFGVAVCFYPFSSLWGTRWWLIQLIELGTSISFLVFLFFHDTRNRRKLLSSNEDLDRFASVAAHDLKEPLRMIFMYLELLARENRGKLSKSSEEFLWYAHDGALRMNALLDALSAYAHLEFNTKTFCAVDLNHALDNAIQMLEPAIVEKGAVITRDTLPIVDGEPAFLIQLFQNLLANAIKYQREGVRPEIHVFSRLQKGNWVIGVRDNGLGFPKKNAELIFQPFRRLHSKAEFPGSGLGLATCKKIVELHRGEVWADSQEDKGSVFYFTVPVSTQA